MDEKQEFEALNPAIKEVTIGIRKLRKIKIYPLSMADQLTFSGTVIGSLVDMFSQRELPTITFASLIHKIISEKLGSLLVLITDDGEKLLSELTNEQAFQIAEIVYSVNYGTLEEKAGPFVEKLRKLFLPQQLSPQSSEAILSSDLKISSEDPSGKEA